MFNFKSIVKPKKLVIDVRHPEHESILDAWYLSFTSDNRYMICGTDGGTVHVYKVESGEEVHSFVGHKGLIRGALFSFGIYTIIFLHSSFLKRQVKCTGVRRFFFRAKRGRRPSFARLRPSSFRRSGIGWKQKKSG